MRKYIVDRFEEDLAVCENQDGGFENIPISLLPKDIREGSCFFEKDGLFYIDKEETEDREQKMKELFNSLLKKKQ